MCSRIFDRRSKRRRSGTDDDLERCVWTDSVDQSLNKVMSCNAHHPSVQASATSCLTAYQQAPAQCSDVCTQVDPMADVPDDRQCGAAPSQHSAPAMPSEAPVTSPHRQLPQSASDLLHPPDADGAQIPGEQDTKENQIHSFFRCMIHAYSASTGSSGGFYHCTLCCAVCKMQQLPKTVSHSAVLSTYILCRCWFCFWYAGLARTTCSIVCHCAVC